MHAYTVTYSTTPFITLHIEISGTQNLKIKGLKRAPLQLKWLSMSESLASNPIATALFQLPTPVVM